MFNLPQFPQSIPSLSFPGIPNLSMQYDWLPILTWYEPTVSADGCIIIIQKYYDNIFKQNKIYDLPIVIYNPFCKPPIPPPQPPPQKNPDAPLPNLECSGDILITRIPIYFKLHRESNPLTYGSQEIEVTGTLSSVNFPLQDDVNNDTYGVVSISWVIKTWTTEETFLYSNVWVKKYASDYKVVDYRISKSPFSYDEGDYLCQLEASRNTSGKGRQWRVETRWGGTQYSTFTAYIGSWAKTFYDAEFNNNSSVNRYTGATTSGFFNSGDPQYFYQDDSTSTSIDTTEIAFFTQCYSTPAKYGDPYDPPPPPDKPMTCCPQNDQLLKLILQRIGTLPVNVPDSLVAKNPKPLKINSLVEFLSWQGKQTDAITGQFPVEIEVEDADFTDMGNQKLVMSLPNMAELMSEMLGLLILLKRESDVTVQTSIKGMLEAGAAKQAAQVAVDLGLANAEFLGYKLDKKKKTITFTFNPDQAEFSKLLMDTETKYYSYENTDKKDIKDFFMPLLQLAQRWNAQNFVKLAKNGAQAAAQLKKLLTNPEELAKELEKNADADFKDWAEEAEDGYSNLPQTPVDDKGKPYGQDKEARPKIRKLGDF